MEKRMAHAEGTIDFLHTERMPKLPAYAFFRHFQTA